MDTYKIIVEEIDGIGEVSRAPYDWHTAIHPAGTGRVQRKPPVTHPGTPDRGEKAFDLAATSNECLRVAVKP